MSYYNQMWQDGCPACTGLTLQVRITSPKLAKLRNIYGYFFFISSRPMSTKLGRMVDQYALTLLLNMTSSTLGHVKNMTLSLLLHIL